MAEPAETNSGDATGRREPVFTRRFFTGAATVEAAVWPTTAGSGQNEFQTFNVTVQRSYKDANTGEYKRSQSFWPQDVPALALALQDCARWIAEQTQRR